MTRREKLEYFAAIIYGHILQSEDDVSNGRYSCDEDRAGVAVSGAVAVIDAVNSLPFDVLHCNNIPNS